MTLDTIKVTGNTYAYRSELKDAGFTYVPRYYDFNRGENVKAFWYKTYENYTEDEINDRVKYVNYRVLDIEDVTVHVSVHHYEEA